jgi:hypothetical protein
MNETFTSLQQQVDLKTKNRKRIWNTIFEIVHFIYIEKDLYMHSKVFWSNKRKSLLHMKCLKTLKNLQFL